MSFDPESIRRELSTQWIGSRVYWLESTGSTNDIAWSLAEGGLPSGTVVGTDHQETGRGSRGRTWVAPPRSSLLVSILVRAEIPPDRLPGLTSAASIGVAEGLRKATGADIEILWPNDLVSGKRKTGGLLVESRSPSPGGAAFVIGCGINVHQADDDWPAELRGRATSLDAATGRRQDRLAILLELLQALEHRLDQFKAGELTRLQEALDRYARLRGRRAAFEFETTTTEGTVLHIDVLGAVTLRDDEGRTHELPPERIRAKRELDG